MAGYRYTNEERELLTNVVKDAKCGYEEQLKQAAIDCNIEAVNALTKKIVLAGSTLDKLTGVFGD